MTCDICERRTNQFSKRETSQIKIMEIYEANQIFVIGIKRFYKGLKNGTKIKFK
jgi:hypothetical protein